MKTRLKTYNHIFLAILFAGLVILGFGATKESLPLIAAGLLAAFGSIVFRVIVYRCPYCGHYLGKRDGTYCPHCKSEIE